MNKTMRLAGWLAFSVGIILPAGAAFAFTGQQYAGQAKITLAQARAKALQAYPGTITDQELEKERGGTGLRYSFDIRKGAVTREIGIDARTGRLLENSL